MIIDIYELLGNDSRVRVRLKKQFKNLLRENIENDSIYISLYSKKIGVSKNVLYNYFRNKETNISLQLSLMICRDLCIKKKRLFSNISYFSLQGGHIPVKLPRFIKIDKEFIEGFSLYIGDGVLSKKSNIAFIN